MITTHPERALVLHLRARRQWQGDLGLSQQGLARRAGIPLRTLRRYEAAREPLQAVEPLLDLAAALGTTVEGLFDPRYLARRRERCAARQDPRDAVSVTAVPWILAVSYFSPYLALAVLSDADIEIIELRRLSRRQRRRIRQLIQEFVTDYDIGVVVVEPRHSTLPATNPGAGCSIAAISVPEAKAVLMPGEARPSHQHLAAHLVEHYPKLRRLLRTSRTLPSAATARLLAAALGLAARQQLRTSQLAYIK